MPVTFAHPPSANKGRRLSASAPFPGRVMTSLVPADLPRKKRTSSSGSGRGARGSVSSIASGVGSYGAAGSTSGPGPVPENPFADDSGIARTADYERMSPQGDSVPAVAIYTSNGDAERQALLAVREEEEEEEDDRLEVPWAFTLAIAGAIGIATFVILYIWRMAEEEGTLAAV